MDALTEFLVTHPFEPVVIVHRTNGRSDNYVLANSPQSWWLAQSVGYTSLSGAL